MGRQKQFDRRLFDMLIPANCRRHASENRVRIAIPPIILHF
jgi:hypothetical protein